MTVPSAHRADGGAATAATPIGPGRAGPRRRRLLMIARDFPPASTSGSLRALKSVRYLSEYGWDASVVTLRTPFYGADDPGLLGDLPPGCRVHRTAGFDTKAVLAIRGRYLRLLATPDRAISWLPPAIAACVRSCRTEHPDVLLSTSPPVTAQCVGLVVKRVTGLPWIIELRDAWNLDAGLGPLSGRVDGWLERRCVTAADGIVVTTEALAAALTHRFGRQVGAKVVVVANGYDDDEFACLPARSAAAGNRFRIVHIGQCHPPERDPTPMLRALRAALDRETLPADTEVVFVGAGAACGRALAPELRRLRLEAHVRCTERLSHRDAVGAMVDAPVLLLLQDRDEHRHSIPAKAYEYLRSHAAILVVAPPHTATTAALQEFPGVWQAGVEPASIGRCLVDIHRRWRDGGGQVRFVRGVEHLSRRHLTLGLARVLDAQVATGGMDRGGRP